MPTNKPEVVLPVHIFATLNEVERHALDGVIGNLEYEAGDVEDSAPSRNQDEDAYWAYHAWHAINKLRGGDNSHYSVTRPADGEFVMVPREPTPKMIDATWDHEIDRDGGVESQNTRNRRIWNAMLSAAPQQTGREVGEAERGLQTPRRMKAVELLLALGYQWDGSQWTQPHQPAEAVAVDLEQFREAVEGYRAIVSALEAETNANLGSLGTAYCDRLLAIIDNAPPAIDIGKLRELDDTRRLNWLATFPRGAHITVDGEFIPCIFWGVSAEPETTLREAIDAAMNAAALIGDGGERANG